MRLFIRKILASGSMSGYFLKGYRLNFTDEYVEATTDITSASHYVVGSDVLWIKISLIFNLRRSVSS